MNSYELGIAGNDEFCDNCNGIGFVHTGSIAGQQNNNAYFLGYEKHWVRIYKHRAHLGGETMG